MIITVSLYLDNRRRPLAKILYSLSRVFIIGGRRDY